ncbi:MAG: hypothetical protein K940chlam3_01422 [Chlamydiae bacterium]|nr:hypothetical protein [Chlamydiota bacterium]
MIKLFDILKNKSESFQNIFPERAVPTEVILTIFSFLETEELLTTCSLVSKSWKWIIDSEINKFCDYEAMCKKNGWEIPSKLLDVTFGSYETIAKAPVLTDEQKGLVKDHGIGPCQMTAPVQKWKDESGLLHIVGRIRPTNYMADIAITLRKTKVEEHSKEDAKQDSKDWYDLIKNKVWRFESLVEYHSKKKEFVRDTLKKFTNYKLSAKITTPKGYLISKGRDRLQNVWWTTPICDLNGRKCICISESDYK